jgi:hypothetical protein
MPTLQLNTHQIGMQTLFPTTPTDYLQLCLGGKVQQITVQKWLNTLHPTILEQTAVLLSLNIDR